MVGIRRQCDVDHPSALFWQKLLDADRDYFDRILSVDVSDVDVTFALNRLSDFLSRYYGKKVIILLDGHDMPMKEAYVNGYL